MRSASEAPSTRVREGLRRRPASGPALDAEHGQRKAIELAAQRIAEPAHGRVILEDEDSLVPIEEVRQPLPVEAVEPRQRDDGEAEPLLFEELRRGECLVHHHGPVREHDRVVTRPNRRAAPRRDLFRCVDPPRRGSDGESDRDVLRGVLHCPAQERPGLVGTRGLHDRDVRQRSQQRDVAQRLVRLPGPPG